MINIIVIISDLFCLLIIVHSLLSYYCNLLVLFHIHHPSSSIIYFTATVRRPVPAPPHIRHGGIIITGDWNWNSSKDCQGSGPYRSDNVGMHSLKIEMQNAETNQISQISQSVSHS